MAHHLSIHDDLNTFNQLSVESDEWRAGRLDFIRDSPSTISRQQSPPIQVPSTDPGDRGRRRMRLGVGHIRG